MQSDLPYITEINLAYVGVAIKIEEPLKEL